MEGCQVTDLLRRFGSSNREYLMNRACFSLHKQTLFYLARLCLYSHPVIRVDQIFNLFPSCWTGCECICLSSVQPIFYFEIPHAVGFIHFDNYLAEFEVSWCLVLYIHLKVVGLIILVANFGAQWSWSEFEVWNNPFIRTRLCTYTSAILHP